MKTIIDKLKEYRNSTAEITLNSMFDIKEIYDSYLMNKEHNMPVPNWDVFELKLL